MSQAQASPASDTSSQTAQSPASNLQQALADTVTGFERFDLSLSKKIAGIGLARDAMHLEDQRRTLAISSEQVRQSLNNLSGLNIQGALVQPSDTEDGNMIHVGDITINNPAPAQFTQQPGATQDAAPAPAATVPPSVDAGQAAAPATPAATVAPAVVPAVAQTAAAVAATPTGFGKAALLATALGGYLLSQLGSGVYSYFNQPTTTTTTATTTNQAGDPLEYDLKLAQ